MLALALTILLLLSVSTAFVLRPFAVARSYQQHQVQHRHRRCVGSASIVRGGTTRVLRGAVIDDLSDNEEVPVSTQTDAEAGKTHGYEGDFKVGDVVRVKEAIRIWSVKEYSKEGFVCQGYQGTVKELALYGRKQKSLCSAITPVKVEFAPDGPGVPAGMFARKWLAHFSGEELELVQKAAPPA